MSNCRCYDTSVRKLEGTRPIDDINGDGAKDLLELYSAPKYPNSFHDVCCKSAPENQITGLVRFGDPKRAGKFLRTEPTRFIRASDHKVFRLDDKVSYNGKQYIIGDISAEYDASTQTVSVQVTLTDLHHIFVEKVDINRLK